MTLRHIQASFNIYRELHLKRRGKHSTQYENSKQTSAALATTAPWRRADFQRTAVSAIERVLPGTPSPATRGCLSLRAKKSATRPVV